MRLREVDQQPESIDSTWPGTTAKHKGNVTHRGVYEGRRFGDVPTGAFGTNRRSAGSQRWRRGRQSRERAGREEMEHGEQEEDARERLTAGCESINRRKSPAPNLPRCACSALVITTGTGVRFDLPAIPGGPDFLPGTLKARTNSGRPEAIALGELGAGAGPFHEPQDFKSRETNFIGRCS